MAEAVGQLAAWAAMAAVDFKRRPVAGIAGASIELLAPVQPGQVLELAADWKPWTTRPWRYGGTAMSNGMPVIRLEHCVGPMVPRGGIRRSAGVARPV